MKWEKVRLGKFITPKKGFAFKSSKYVASGVPIVRVSNFTNDSISNDDLKYYPLEEKVNFGEFELCEKDVIIQTVGSWQNNPASVVGKVVRVPYYLDGALLNQNAVKLIPKNSIDKNYLFYRLKTDAFKGHVLGEARGAANQASITLDTIKSFEFLIPDKKKQIKIGNILSSYDDLIENNQKQIKLLEEAAQRLYKEWFVDLRFPGYEKTPIIDCVPEGWNHIYLENVISKITTGLNPRKNFVLGNGNNYYVTIKNMRNNNVYLDEKCDRIDDEAIIKINKRSNLQIGDILFSGIGTMGRVYLVNIPTNNWNVSESVFTLRANNKISKELLYLILLSDNVQKYCDQHAHGVAQRGIRMADLKAYKFVLPSKNIIENFTKIIKPIINKIQNLNVQIVDATKARDRLLTKLMSGEIEV